MKDKYIKNVKKELRFAGKKKADILNDLNETFESGIEHGESEQDIIQRLGTPAEFVHDIYEQMGIDATAKEINQLKIRAIISFAIFVILFGCVAVSNFYAVPAGVIGQADALTGILVEGNGISVVMLLLVLCIIAFIFTVINIVRYIRHKR